MLAAAGGPPPPPVAGFLLGAHAGAAVDVANSFDAAVTDAGVDAGLLAKRLEQCACRGRSGVVGAPPIRSPTPPSPSPLPRQGHLS